MRKLLIPLALLLLIGTADAHHGRGAATPPATGPLVTTDAHVQVTTDAGVNVRVDP